VLKKHPIITFIFFGFILFLISNRLDELRVYQGATVAVYAIGIASLILLIGYSGQVSLGHGALLAIGGYAPSTSNCSRCEKVGPHRYFSLVGGGSVCAECRPSACATPAPETLELLGALLSGDWEVAQASEPRNRREASGLVIAYLQWHLERGLRSLPIVERV
jgi:ABC-type branched-subunit amino acid transport system permease subunit